MGTDTGETNVRRPNALGLTTEKADQKNALNEARKTEVWGVFQEVAKSARSARGNEQLEMTAMRATVGELGQSSRALGAGHIAVARYLEASRP